MQFDEQKNTLRLTKRIGPQDHTMGGLKNAKLVLVEYGDYECPFCSRASTVMVSLIEEFGQDLCYVYRHFPLTETHPYAMDSALAAEAAGAQNKFWEMHQLLYKNQKSLKKQDLINYAKQLDLNLTRFFADLEDDLLIDKIQHDFQSGIQSGVNSTPSFFINNLYYDGPWDFPNLKLVLQEVLNRSTSKRKAG